MGYDARDEVRKAKEEKKSTTFSYEGEGSPSSQEKQARIKASTEATEAMQQRQENAGTLHRPK